MDGHIVEPVMLTVPDSFEVEELLTGSVVPSAAAEVRWQEVWSQVSAGLHGETKLHSRVRA